MFSCEEEYAAHCNAMADTEAEIAALEGEAETANDEQIIELARKLVKAINDSGRKVLRPEVSGGGFGSLTIWIHGGSLIEVEYFGERSYVISGPIDGVE